MVPFLKHAEKSSSKSARILPAGLLSISIYSTYFYILMRQQFSLLLQRQSALESIDAITVPGASFLKQMGNPEILNSSLFYLATVGMILLVFMLVSISVGSLRIRAFILLAGILILAGLMAGDRISFSFTLVIVLSFSGFYGLTLRCKISLSLKEALLLMFCIILITISLYYNARHNKFFLKIRDMILFDTSIGNKISSYYYRHSPLAAALISVEQDVYQGLVFFEEIKHDKALHLGRGIFLSGKHAVKTAADFVITRQGKDHFISNRYGHKINIAAMHNDQILSAIEPLFSMKGFLLLNQIGIYFFPAGFLLLALMGIRWFYGKKTFIITGAALTATLLLIIWHIGLSGSNCPETEGHRAFKPARDGLASLYCLVHKEEIPEIEPAIIKEMIQADSAALRYWGVYLLGFQGDTAKSAILVKLLSDPFLNVRYVAAQSLYKLRKKGSFEHLKDRLHKDPSWYVRCKIFSILLSTGMLPCRVFPEPAH